MQGLKLTRAGKVPGPKWPQKEKARTQRNQRRTQQEPNVDPHRPHIQQKEGPDGIIIGTIYTKKGPLCELRTHFSRTQGLTAGNQKSGLKDSPGLRTQSPHKNQDPRPEARTRREHCW